MTRWRAASLIAVHLLFALHLLHWKLWGRTLAPVEPSEMFDTLHLGVVTVGFLFMAGLVAATAIAGRFFCGWGCHVLALQDLSEWLLRKLRVPTKPLRSRTLVWVPPLAVFYLFVWPQIERVLRGDPFPRLHVVADPDGWTSFTTTDLLRSFPGLGMTLFTFFVCGFAIVYFMGSRSFCAYACPYGAIFAAAERLSPLRIVAGNGACSDCGLCTASCRSSVQVIEEVRLHGAVMNANCMKDLDCVTVCPTEAIRLATTKPPLFRSWRPAGGPKKPYDFTLGEDLLIAAVFAVSLPILRGLYDSIALLLALALSALVAYSAAVAWRLLVAESVQVAGVVLKKTGRLTGRGALAAGAIALLAAFMLHSGVVRGHTYTGEWIAAHAEGEIDSLKLALSQYERADRWGLVSPRGLRQRLADLYQRTGSNAKARDQLNALLAGNPEDLQSRLQIAQLWRLDGRDALARRQAEQVLVGFEQIEQGEAAWSDRRVAASAHVLLGDLSARARDVSVAVARMRSAIEVHPEHGEAHMALGALLAAEGRVDEALRVARSAAQLMPDSPAAHNNLASILERQGRLGEALELYRRCVTLAPDSSLTLNNLGRLLLKMGRPEEAETVFKEVLKSQPADAEAQQALELIDYSRPSHDESAP